MDRETMVLKNEIATLKFKLGNIENEYNRKVFNLEREILNIHNQLKDSRKKFDDSIERLKYQNGLDLYYASHKDNYTNTYNTLDELNSIIKEHFKIELEVEVYLSEHINYDSIKLNYRYNKDLNLTSHFKYDLIIDKLVRTTAITDGDYIYHTNLDELLSLIKREIFEIQLDV